MRCYLLLVYFGRLTFAASALRLQEQTCISCSNRKYLGGSSPHHCVAAKSLECTTQPTLVSWRSWSPYLSLLSPLPWPARARVRRGRTAGVACATKMACAPKGARRIGGARPRARRRAGSIVGRAATRTTARARATARRVRGPRTQNLAVEFFVEAVKQTNYCVYFIAAVA